jgi:hypothetical protein
MKQISVKVVYYISQIVIYQNHINGELCPWNGLNGTSGLVKER